MKTSLSFTKKPSKFGEFTKDGDILYCFAWQGLCNRINCMASALATGRPVVLHWAINDHCPITFEEVFGSIEGIKAFDEERKRYHPRRNLNELCWFYPHNLMKLEIGIFRENMYAAYKEILQAAKMSVPLEETSCPLGLQYRHYLPDRGEFDSFLEGAKRAIEFLRPTSVHISSDSLKHKQVLIESLSRGGMPVFTNTVKLLKHDLERGRESVFGMVTDLCSMSKCRLGVICNSTRSSIPDSLRAYGVTAYYTYDDGKHRYRGRDDLFEHKPVEMIWK